MTTSKQSGMTFAGLMLTLVLVAFFALLAIKIIPLYTEWGTVSSALDNLVESNLGKQGKTAMTRKLGSQFSVDNVDAISARDIVFKQSKDGKHWEVTAEYEARALVYGNIGAFVLFSKTVEVPK